MSEALARAAGLSWHERWGGRLFMAEG